MALTSFLYDLNRGIEERGRRKRRENQIILPNGDVLTGEAADQYRKIQLLQEQGKIDKAIQEAKNQGLLGATGIEGQTARDVAGIRNKGLLAQTEAEGANRLKAIGIEGKYSLKKQEMAGETAENIAGIQTGSAEQIAVLNALAKGGAEKGRYKDVTVTLPDGSEVPRVLDTATGQFKDELSGNTGTFNADQYVGQRTGNTGLTASSLSPSSVPPAPLTQSTATRPSTLTQSSAATQAAPLVKPIQPPSPTAPPDTSVKDVSRQIQGIVSMSGLGPKASYQPMVKPVVDIGGALSGLKSTFYDQALKAAKSNLRILRNSRRK